MLYKIVRNENTSNIQYWRKMIECQLSVCCIVQRKQKSTKKQKPKSKVK